METLQNQISNLSNKLDALYQVIARLEGKVAEALFECSLSNRQQKGNSNDLEKHQLKTQSNCHPQLQHKDILTDGMYLEINRQSGEKKLPPEVQIQRLTAQLTAAYNRIAALEEQLMKQRIH